ncbi:MAG TPA: DUF4126 domain-containing protein [Chloroflexota bacterium]|jgi:hypothetical protein|nr:DUF4126 domain-containing protein [Chloroflexota bacterium]
MDPLLLGTASAFGLAAAAGLNTTLPLLIVGLLARFGLLTLAPPFDALSGDVVLGGLVLLAGLEIVGDKVPGADSVVQLLQWPLAAAAGAILFASQTSVVSWVSPQLAILVGLLTAGAVHGARTALRPVITGATVGLGNPVQSFGEDVYAATLAGTAVLFPLLGLLLLLALAGAAVFAAYWTWRLGGRLWRRVAAVH